MKRIIVLLVFLTCLSARADDYTPYMHKFEIWGTLTTYADKLHFLTGFTNGYFVKRGDATLYDCLSQNVSYDQAIAMVDKYYKTHPEKWNEPAGEEVILALTVPDGPCPKIVGQR